MQSTLERHPVVLPVLRQFSLERVLNEEPEKSRITLLGSLPSVWRTVTSSSSSPGEDGPESSRLQTIIRVARSAFSARAADELFSADGHLSEVKLTESTDIYSWLAAWTSSSHDSQPQGDLTFHVICPATDVHVRKYSRQTSILVQETPTLYENVTLPYIDAFPPGRTQWVTDILEGRSEQDKILYNDGDFVLLPDMKWDLHTVQSLYLVSIARDSSLRSIRDLRASHLPFLKKIRSVAAQVTDARWGISRGGLRMWVHYQPSYYRFHVHVANANYEGAGMGMAVGQAHLLDDVISLLELDGNIFRKMTLTYALGDQHGLYPNMKAVQRSLADS